MEYIFFYIEKNQKSRKNCGFCSKKLIKPKIKVPYAIKEVYKPKAPYLKTKVFKYFLPISFK